MFKETTWIRGRNFEEPNNRILFEDLNESKLRHSKWSVDLQSDDTHTHDLDINKRFSYCYLCSIGAHEHKKTEPVPIEKRRYLRPYLNPIQLMRKYEKNQQDFQNKTKYKFIVKTGVGQYAGTDSTVMFVLYGTAGTWEQTELKPKNNSANMKFPSNSLVEVELMGPIIGDLKKLKIWHSGKSIKEGWYLDFIEITCYSQMQTWRFVCDQWLSIHRPPNNSNSAILTLNSNVFDNEKTKNMTEYFFMFKTSGKPLYGKDINVQFQFTATKFQSLVFNLLTPYVNLFDRNQLDCFMVSSSQDLGPPEKLRLAHNASKMPHQWSIDYIKVVYSKEPTKAFIYKIDKWLEKNDRMNAIISFHSDLKFQNENTASSKKIYHISVITGNHKLAGTDSRIFIEMKGTKGLSRAHRLQSSKKRAFERGQIDHFHIFEDDIGDVKMIKIWHDNSGAAPGWFLDAVLIRSMSTTLSGNESKQDSEVYLQLDKISKKFRIKNLKPEEIEKLENKKPRSKSAELSRKTVKSKSIQRPRSVSSNYKRNTVSSRQDDLKKSIESRASPTPSILKNPTSPRTRRDMMKKQVKFETAEKTKEKKGEKPNPVKVEMNVNWLMSINYSDDSRTIKSVRTVENYDKSIKSIDNKLVSLYESKLNKSLKKPEETVTATPKPVNENLIYVFECNKWLAKDKEDRQTERILKITNVLTN